MGFQGIEVGASAEAKINSIDIYFEASMALSGEGGLQLGRFEITNVGHIDVSVSGLGPLDWILGKLAGAIADTIKGFIIPLIEGPIRKKVEMLAGAIADTIKGFIIPLIEGPIR